MCPAGEFHACVRPTNGAVCARAESSAHHMSELQERARSEESLFAVELASEDYRSGGLRHNTRVAWTESEQTNTNRR